MKLLLIKLCFIFSQVYASSSSISFELKDKMNSECSVITTLQEIGKPYQFVGFSILNKWCGEKSLHNQKIFAHKKKY